MKAYLGRVEMQLIRCFAFVGEFETVVDSRKIEGARKTESELPNNKWKGSRDSWISQRGKNLHFIHLTHPRVLAFNDLRVYTRKAYSPGT
jgi:hypothetical protein